MRLKVGKTDYKVKIADTNERRFMGLRGVDNMPKGHGLVLKFDETQFVPISMKGMKIPLSLVFISGGKVVQVRHADPEQSDINIPDPVDLVLEINKGEHGGIRPGTKVEWIGSKEKGGVIDFVEDDMKAEEGALHVLTDTGSIQAKIQGNERVFSRKHTKQLINASVKASKTKEAKDYIVVGRAMYNMINKQNTQDPEYVIEQD